MRRVKDFYRTMVCICLAFMLLALAGCGSNTETPRTSTKSTATGSVTADGSGSVSTSTRVTAPLGNTLTIQQGTILTSDAAATTPVPGAIATTVSYSTSAADLPAPAQTLPTGATLAAFLDIFMGDVKYLSKALQITMNVVAGGANPGDTVAIYSFNGVTNRWEPADDATVSSDGTAPFSIRHLSLWAAFKTATPPPGRPTGSSATAGNSQVTVSWSAPKAGPTPTAYNVYYGNAPGVTTAGGTKIENAVSPCVIKGLVNGTTYYFAVTAVNANGEGGLSSEERAAPDATMQPPASPNGVSVTPGPGNVTIQWNTKISATSYNVYYAASGSISSAELLAGGSRVTVPAAADPQPATQSEVISGLTPGSVYSFIVTAENTAGESAAQSTPKKATPQ